MNNLDLENLKDFISQNNKIIIVTHNNPDGDAIGSSLALYNYLKNIGKNVDVIVPNHFPDNLAWLKGADKILVYKAKTEICEKIINEADLIFCLDFNAFHRLDKLENPLRVAKAKKILIDHHLQPELQSFDLAFSKIDISSTAELTYNLITSISNEGAIDLEIANCIYVGIITDTGSFSYSCNYENTFLVSANLLKIGIDSEKIHRKVYDTFSESRLRLLGYCLSDKLVVINEFSTAYISLTKDELKKFNYQNGDTEGVVNYALSIDKIKLAALFTEREGVIRISFRAKGDIDVNSFARKYFDGGGHRNAAGASSNISLDETILKFTSNLNIYKDILEPL